MFQPVACRIAVRIASRTVHGALVEDGKVKLGAGEGKGTLVMKIDAKGCLDGGLFYGTMCKQT